MRDHHHISCQQISLPRLAELATEQGDCLLGVTCLGNREVASQGPLAALPLQGLATPLLDGSGAMAEAWLSATPCSSGEWEGIRYRSDGHLLFGVLELEEANFPATAGTAPLQQAAEAAYRRIFQLLDREGYAHLWRTWNYLAEINAESHGLERYRQFNSGRQEAFIACGRLPGTIPAACALGTADGPLSIAFLAARHAPLAIENRRQTAAYDYPAEYGPRSPTFSRAVLAQLPGTELFLLSGTASIVGHRTTYPGDVVGQTRETLANIDAVLEEANRTALAGPYRLEELSCRAYLRHPENLPRVRPLLEAALGPTAAAVTYVQADVCRADLLIEIEAMASHALPR
ncbi:MAG TPA: hypothetical protein VJ548_01700 [Azospira sp.]|nr:hypothetical protein [Azospira sp.]